MKIEDIRRGSFRCKSATSLACIFRTLGPAADILELSLKYKSSEKSKVTTCEQSKGLFLKLRLHEVAHDSHVTLTMAITHQSRRNGVS